MRRTSTQVTTEIATARQALAQGDVTAATQIIGSLLASNPDHSEVYFAQAMILMAQDLHSEALGSIEGALKFSPNNPDLLAWGALTCLTLAMGAKAEGFASRLVKLQPNNDRAIYLLSNSQSLQGRLEEALASIERALLLQPIEVDYISGKAQLLGRLHWSSQAIKWYRKSLRLRSSPQLAIELAQVLMEEGYVQEAIELLESVQNQMPSNDFPHHLLGQAYTEAQCFDIAKTYWHASTKSAVEPAKVLFDRANAEVFAGRLDVAEDILLSGIKQQPSAASLYQLLTSIRRMTAADSALIDAMELQLAKGDIQADELRDLSYALGKSYSDLGNFAGAMEHYDEANQMAYRLAPHCQKFDAAAWSKYTDDLIEYFDRGRIQQLSAKGLDSRSPIFILGMIRSGTTLTEQIISSHSEISAGGETTFWPDHRNDIFDPASKWFDVEAGKRGGKAFLNAQAGRAKGARYVTEKNPSNVTIASLIHCVLPKAKMLHIQRHPVDTLLSIWMTPIRTGLPFVYNRQHIVSAYRDYLRLVSHLADTLPPGVFATFQYEEITSKPAATIDAMFEHLGLPTEGACLHPERSKRTVRTPSSYQVRQPINTNSQSKWVQYEPWLAEFADLL